MGKLEEKIIEKAKKVVRENHCRYCYHIGEKDVSADRCEGDIEYILDFFRQELLSYRREIEKRELTKRKKACDAVARTLIARIDELEGNS